MHPDQNQAYFELSFSPNLSLVSTVRRFVSDFWNKILPSPDVTSQLAVAAHELLDNAVLYSYDGNTHVRIEVEKEPGTARVTITTRNRASPANLSRVQAAIQKVASATDPSAFYQATMRAAAQRAEGSGLGLARVRAESEMAISHEVEGDTVIMRASARFPLEEAR
jgi:anti-sigma regulatory factor (Ser/Thr protein kinase)